MKRHALMGLLLAALIVAACGPTAPAPAPTAAPGAAVKPPTLRTKANPGETITYYHFGDLSGPLAAISAPLIFGFNDAVAYYNKQGGIRGAEVKIEWSDTGGKIENAISAYNRFREKKPLFMYLYGSGDTEALRERLVEDKIPALTAGVSGKGLYPPAYAFGEVPIYADQFGMFVDWLVANWDKVKPAKGQNLDKPVIGVITWDTAYGLGAVTDESRAYVEKKGVKIVALEKFTAGAPDVTTQILNVKKAGANVIYTNSLATGPTQIAKDLISLGVRDEFLFGGNNWALDTSFLALAGAASEGFYGPFPTLFWTDADHPGVKLAGQLFTENNRQAAAKGVAYLLSVAAVDYGKQILEKTIDRVGFDGLSNTAVFETLITAGEIKALDGVLTIGYTKDTRAPNKARIAQIQKGKIVTLTDLLTAPDLKPAAK